MSWDLVVLTVREPTPAHQRMAFDAWPEHIQGIERGEWLEEVVSADGVLRLQVGAPGEVEDLDQLRFLELDLSPVLSPPVWFTEINVPAGAGDEGRMLAALLARTLITECGGVVIDRQTGLAHTTEGPVELARKPADYPTVEGAEVQLVLNSWYAGDPVDLAGVMAALDQHLPAAYPTRWGWDEPLRKKPPKRPPTTDPDTWAPWLEEGGAWWRGPEETITGRIASHHLSRQVPPPAPATVLGQEISIEAPADQLPASGYRPFMAHAVTAAPRNVGIVQVLAETEDGWHGVGLGMMRTIDGEIKVRTFAGTGIALPVLQELPWGMLWGRPYLELIGREPFEKLAAAGCVHMVEFFDDDHVWTQLTPDPVDIRTDYPAYAKARDAAKEILGPDLFLREDWGFDDPRYRTPVFPKPKFIAG